MKAPCPRAGYSTENCLPVEELKTTTPSNVEAVEGKLPDRLLRLLPAPQTLRQGAWDVANQFQYSTRITVEQTMGLFYATFRRSFAVAAFTAINRTLFNFARGLPLRAQGNINWSLKGALGGVTQKCAERRNAATSKHTIGWKNKERPNLRQFLGLLEL